MIPIEMVTAARIMAAKAGDLFLPRDGEGGDRFLLGQLNGKYPVAAILDGEKAFEFADLEQWSGRRGLIVSQYRLLVDHVSSVRPEFEDTGKLGTLYLDGTNAGILVQSATGNRHLLPIRGEITEVGDDCAAFTSWSIVTQGPADILQELFSYGEGVEGWLESLAS